MVSDMQHKLAYDNLHTISAEILLSHSSMHDFDVNSLCKKNTISGLYQYRTSSAIEQTRKEQYIHFQRKCWSYSGTVAITIRPYAIFQECINPDWSIT